MTRITPTGFRCDRCGKEFIRPPNKTPMIIHHENHDYKHLCEDCGLLMEAILEKFWNFHTRNP